MRLNKLRDDVLKDEDDLIGKQAVRTLKEGRPITLRDVKDEVIIKRGDKVTAVYNHKGLQITSKMEDLEDGAKGKFIKVLNTKSAKEIGGKVLNKNTVEIAAE
jgi:flagella basal body P-ring formation protein FlgA